MDAGMSRSPAVVAAALSIVQGGSPDGKLRQVVAGQPHDVSPQVGGGGLSLCIQGEGRR
jgi:hypothetical protein